MDALSRCTAGPRKLEALERSGWKVIRAIGLPEPVAVHPQNPSANHAACIKCGAYKAWAKPCWNCGSGKR